MNTHNYPLSNTVKRSLGLMLVIAAFGCTETQPPQLDGEDDAVVGTERGDTGGFYDGTEAACRVVYAANYASEEELRAANVHEKVIANLLNKRIGDDSIPGSGDETVFATVSELDGVPFVGPYAFQALHNAGWSGSMYCAQNTWRPDGGSYYSDAGSHFPATDAGQAIPSEVEACQDAASALAVACNPDRGFGSERCGFSTYRNMCATRERAMLGKLTNALLCVVPGVAVNTCETFSSATMARTCVANAVGALSPSQRVLFDGLNALGCTAAAANDLDIVPYLNEMEAIAAGSCMRDARDCGTASQCVFRQISAYVTDPSCGGN